ncbi:ubiquinol-cytochrome c reductase iron-sulfur subunit [Lysobacteraceae bacterium NML08-0793]|nr:ubiquinol-cytochrome c reductase iron-sulfur subunit [Xanthomonadaceae bacterium NML08-0793]
MANDEIHTPVDPGRRRFLTATTAVVGAVGAGFAAVPFIKSWNPSARAKLAGAPVVRSVSDIEVGTQIEVIWRGQPIYIARRSPAMVETLAALNDKVVDPESNNADQTPAFAKNQHRSIKPEILVLVGVCTHLGCAPQFIPEVKPQAFDPDWKGGYFCPCHKSKYDIAGRVYHAQPAPLALPVPPYHFQDDETLVIGIEPQGGA